jgi:hypothetical protein
MGSPAQQAVLSKPNRHKSRSSELTIQRAKAATLTLMLILSVPFYAERSNIFTARAQSPTATLAGTVLDESGAVMPSVRVTVLNLGTALQRHATTNDEGYFAIPLLPPGSYNLTAQQTGFATLEVRDVMLNVNDQLALRIRLKIGEIGETVTVLGGLEGLQQSSGTSTVVNRQFVENLPLNGRSFQSLIELAPGTVLTRANFDEQGQFSVNGQRANANYFMVDGVSANFGVSAGAAPGQAAAGSLPALTAFGGTNNLVSVDALEEFRIHTSAYAPEFGRTPGAQISVVSRSGTNEFHGSLFDYFRNDALDANDWFANSRGLPKAAIRQNDFGGVLGGPLVRDRIFFFSSYEGLRLRQPQIAVTEVPSLIARAAAPARIKPFLDAYPLPNGVDTRAGLAEFSASYSEPSRLDALSLRADGFVNERLTIFGRYSLSPSEVIQRGSVIRPGFTAQPLVHPTLALSLNTVSRVSFQTQTLTAGASFALASHTVNEARVNWSRAIGTTDFALDNFGGSVPLPQSLVFPAAGSAENGSFQFLIEDGIASNLNVGKNVDNQQRQLNLVNHLSIARSSHQLKLGVDYRRLMPIYSPATYDQLATFNSVSAPGPPLGTVLSGAAKTVHIFGGAHARYPVFTNVSAYGQDYWRVSPDLTLTYGLRWELNPPPFEAKGNHPLALRRLEDLEDILIGPPGTPLWRTTFLNFAPRLGLAYQLSDHQNRELVVRAGVGLFYDLGTGQAAQGFGSVAPFVKVRRFDDIPFPLTPAQAQPLPLPGSFPLFPITLVIFDPSLQLPRSYQWNVTLDQSLGAEQTLTVSYVGALGRRLLREDAVLGLNAASSVVRLTRNAARSSYHSLQAQATRRLTRGLQAVASYTWSHSIDNASSDALSRLRPASVSPTGTNPLGGDRGPSDYDVRHSFTLAATYNFPSPHTSFAATRGLLRDWSLDTIFRARTPTPVNVVTRTDVTGTGLIVALQHPDLLAGVPIYIDDPAVAGGRRINPAAFRAPPAGPQGTLGQNALQGFAVSQLDLALHRQINFSERLRLQVRAEFFNVFNHPNFGNPIGDLSSTQFGQSTQMMARSLGTGGVNGGLSPIYQIGGARSVQLAIKFLF